MPFSRSQKILQAALQIKQRPHNEQNDDTITTCAGKFIYFLNCYVFALKMEISNNNTNKNNIIFILLHIPPIQTSKKLL